MKPSKEVLNDLYTIQKISPEKIGELFGRSGRQVRTWLTDYDIPRLGATHLRKGKSATWNVGRIHSEEHRQKNAEAHKGKTPSNYGQGRIHFLCEVCGKEVFDKPYCRKRTCSKECKNQLSHIYRGEQHWNYKGDEAGYNQRYRNWSQYREWRTEVLALSNYTCAKCGQRGGRLTVHHLYTWNNHADLRFDPQNGAALCWKCHWAFHRAYGHHNTTAEQFHEWLTKQQ